MSCGLARPPCLASTIAACELSATIDARDRAGERARPPFHAPRLPSEDRSLELMGAVHDRPGCSGTIDTWPHFRGEFGMAPDISIW